jgi:hypothetical protein
LALGQENRITSGKGGQKHHKPGCCVDIAASCRVRQLTPPLGIYPVYLVWLLCVWTALIPVLKGTTLGILRRQSVPGGAKGDHMLSYQLACLSALLVGKRPLATLAEERYQSSSKTRSWTTEVIYLRPSQPTKNPREPPKHLKSRHCRRSPEDS